METILTLFDHARSHFPDSQMDGRKFQRSPKNYQLSMNDFLCPPNVNKSCQFNTEVMVNSTDLLHIIAQSSLHPVQ